MKKKTLVMVLVGFTVLVGANLFVSDFGPPDLILKSPRLSDEELENLLQEGDLVFQATMSSQAGPIAKATDSPITHVGLVFRENDEFRVLEAVEPVREISFREFRAKGTRQAVCVKRPPEGFEMKKVLEEGRRFLGGRYDLLFDWSDQKMYCSELTYKAFERGSDLKIGQMQKVKALDFSSIAVQMLMVRRMNLNLNFSDRIRFHRMLSRHKTFEAWMNSSDWKEGMFSTETLAYLNSPILTPVGQYSDPRLKDIYCDFDPRKSRP